MATIYEAVRINSLKYNYEISNKAYIENISLWIYTLIKCLRNHELWKHIHCWHIVGKNKKNSKNKIGKLVNFYSVTAEFYRYLSYSSKKITSRIKLTTVNNSLNIVLQINKN